MGTLNKDTIENPILLNIISLCEESSPKVSPSKMCTDLGLSRSLITKLRTEPDRTISGDTALKIADYFGVTVDRVLGSDQKEKSPAPDGVGLNEDQKKAIEKILSLHPEELSKKMTALEAVLDM